MRFQRARKPAEKAQRSATILRAALRLAKKIGPAALGLNEVAREAGITKSNIYRYFESREEILVRIYLLELEDLVGHLESLFPGRTSIARVAERITRAFLGRPMFCQLTGMLPSVLEHNLSVEAIVVSKREMLTIISRVIPALRRALPWLSDADNIWFMQSVAIYVPTLWSAANPSPHAAEALSRPELAMLRLDAPKTLQRYVEVVLTGLHADSRAKKR